MGGFHPNYTVRASAFNKSSYCWSNHPQCCVDVVCSFCIQRYIFSFMVWQQIKWNYWVDITFTSNQSFDESYALFRIFANLCSNVFFYAPYALMDFHCAMCTPCTEKNYIKWLFYSIIVVKTHIFHFNQMRPRQKKHHKHMHI